MPAVRADLWRNVRRDSGIILLGFDGIVSEAVQRLLVDSKDLEDAENERGQRQQRDEQEDDAVSSAHLLAVGGLSS